MLDDDFAMYEREQGRLVAQRIKYYEEHTERMERQRALYLASLIQDGLMDANDAFMVVESHKPRGEKRSRIPHDQKQFTARQVQIAMKSTGSKPVPIEYWL